MRYFVPWITATFMLAAILAASRATWADAPDALARTALTDPMATSRSGTVQTLITATIRHSIQVDYALPATTAASGNDPLSPVLQRASARIQTAATGKNRANSAMAAFVQVQGLPNQTFGISVERADRNSGGMQAASFFHSGGLTPHLDPAGDGGFSIDARFDLAHTETAYGYGGTLDVIVSHN